MFQACQGAQPATLYLFKFIFAFVSVSLSSLRFLWPSSPHSPARLWGGPHGPLPGVLLVQGFLIQDGSPLTCQGILDPEWRKICIFIFANLYLNFHTPFNYEIETNHSGLSSTCDSEPKRNLRYFHIALQVSQGSQNIIYTHQYLEITVYIRPAAESHCFMH